jgi:peptidylprolyl isomerase
MRRRARQLAPWFNWQLALGAAAGVAAVVAAVLVVLLVFGSDDGASSQATAGVTPTVTPDTSGPPPTDLVPELTASGLGIIDFEPGSGVAAQTGSAVAVHYTGWLSDSGLKFDSSLDRGTPIELTIGAGQVIPGWEEGLLGMMVGGRRRLVIPPELGYGAAGRSPIPPNAELVFDVELVEIKGTTPLPATPAP